MTFLQEKTAVTQSKFTSIFMVCLSLLLIPLTANIAPKGGWVIFLAGALLFGMIALSYRKSRQNFITINEFGIRCHRCDQQLWCYAWDDIIELRPIDYCHSPGVEIVSSLSPCICGSLLPTGHGFQLCKEAKNALVAYCDMEKRKKLRRIHQANRTR